MLAGVVLAAALAVPVAPREVGASAGLNSNPVIASDGQGFVVFWSTSMRTHFARLRGSGEVVADGEIESRVISTVSGPNGVVIASLWNGVNTRVASITSDGEVRISEPVVRIFAGMAWNGSVLFVIDSSGNAVMTDAEGRVVRRGIHLPVNEETFVAITKRADGFIATWVSRNVLYTALVTSAGDVSPPIAMGSSGFSTPAIACDSATSCLVLFEDRERLQGLIIGANIGAPFTIDSGPGVFPVTPAWDGSHFIVVHSGDEIVHVIAVGRGGNVVPILAVSSPNSNSPAVAASSTDTMVVWSENSACFAAGSQIVARNLGQASESRLTQGLSDQTQASIAAGASSLLVAWSERSDVARIRARLFPFSDAVTISSGPASLLPAIGSDGTGYLVAWQDACQKAIAASRFGSGTTTTLGSNAHWESRPMVTWNGFEYVVVWERTDPTQIVAMRVDRSGQPIDTAPIALTPPEPRQQFTSIRHEPAGFFWTGNSYLLLWNRSKTTYIPWHLDPPPEFDVRASLIARDLSPIGDSRVVAPNAYGAMAAIKSGSIVALWDSREALHGAQLTAQGALISDRVLVAQNDDRISSMTATPSGFAAVVGNEIFYLAPDASLAGHEPLPGRGGMITAEAGVYELDGAVYLLTPRTIPRRRVAR